MTSAEHKNRHFAGGGPLMVVPLFIICPTLNKWFSTIERAF